MEIRDLFVATVALTIGCLLIHASIINKGWAFQMTIARAIAQAKGQAPARFFIGSVGTVMVLMGIYLILAPLRLSFLLPNENGSTKNSHAESVELTE